VAADPRPARAPKVFIYRPVDDTGASHRRMMAAGCEVLVDESEPVPEHFPETACDADALMGASLRRGVMDRAFLASFPNLRIVSKYTIGVDDVDVKAATELGILVTHCPTEANWGGVAEGTLAMMLAFLKKVRQRDRHVKAGGWRDPSLAGVHFGARADGYAGITVGIVGLGRIGSRVAELLGPWRVRLLAADPYVENARFERCGVRRVRLETLLAESDAVTLHCSLTAETRGLIDASALARMKAGALLINTARGQLVDLEALCDALEADRLGGAALDVLPEEPPAPGARVLGLGDRVLLCPHMVGASEGSRLAAAVPWATEATLAALRGEMPEHVYNPDAAAVWRQRFANEPLLPTP
jgi:D-3-phosphoglycerate dehydrogenase / 2-oxoglutarate reductase